MRSSLPSVNSMEADQSFKDFFAANQSGNTDGPSEFYVGYREAEMCPRFLFSKVYDIQRDVVVSSELKNDVMQIKIFKESDIRMALEDYCTNTTSCNIDPDIDGNKIVQSLRQNDMLSN